MTGLDLIIYNAVAGFIKAFYIKFLSDSMRVFITLAVFNVVFPAYLETRRKIKNDK